MPLEAYPPGTRAKGGKPNEFFVFRGRVDGQRHEVRTRIPAGTSKREINQALAEAERAIRSEHVAAESAATARRVPRPGEATTFRRACDLYADARRFGEVERHRLDRLCQTTASDDRKFGEYLLSEIKYTDLVDIAKRMMPNGAAASWNRAVMCVAGAVLHYAAEANLCAYTKIKMFPTPERKTRVVKNKQHIKLLISSAPSREKQLFILWCFRQGMRVSNILQEVRWSKIDLQQQIFTVDILKTGETDVEKVLHPEVFEALAAIPEAERGYRHRIGQSSKLTTINDYVFPWHNRQGVYKWLNPMVKMLGVEFTPHMGRHTFATELNSAGVPAPTGMSLTNHRDIRSYQRYVTPNRADEAAALSKIGRSR